MPCFQLTKVTDSIGQFLEVEWDNDAEKLWQFTKIKDGSGQETIFNYTDVGGQERVTSITPVMNSGLSTPQFQYDGNDRLEVIANQAGFPCQLGYWDNPEEDPDVVMTMVMDKNTLHGTVNLHTEFAYTFVNGVAQLEVTADPSGGVRQYSAGSASNSLVVTNERGFSATHHFNVFGGSVKVTDAENNSSYQVFDLSKRLARRVIDRELRISEMVYDDGMELVSPNVIVDNAPIFNPDTGNFSVVAFFRMKSGETGGTIISHGSGFSISANTTQVACTVAGQSVVLSLPGSAPLDDGYYHGVVMTRENGELKAVLDAAVTDDIAASGSADSSDPVNIGAGFSGRIKMVSFWRAGFSEAQAAALSTGGFALEYGVQGLVTYWPMDDGDNSSGKVVDWVGEHDGDIAGGTWEGFAAGRMATSSRTRAG